MDTFLLGIDSNPRASRCNMCLRPHSCTAWWDNCPTYRREMCNRNQFSHPCTPNGHNSRFERGNAPSARVCTELLDTEFHRCDADRYNTHPIRRCDKTPQDNCRWCHRETCNTRPSEPCCTHFDCSLPSLQGSNQSPQQDKPPQDTCLSYGGNQCSAAP